MCVDRVHAGQILAQGVVGTRPGVTQTCILTPAMPGDANLDGKVDINDLSKVLTSYDATFNLPVVFPHQVFYAVLAIGPSLEGYPRVLVAGLASEQLTGNHPARCRDVSSLRRRQCLFPCLERPH